MSRPIGKQAMLVKNIALSIHFSSVAGREQIFGQLEVNVVKCHVWKWYIKVKPDSFLLQNMRNLWITALRSTAQKTDVRAAHKFLSWFNDIPWNTRKIFDTETEQTLMYMKMNAYRMVSMTS